MTNNKELIKELARVGILQTEPVKSERLLSENDIVFTGNDGEKKKVIVDQNLTNEEILLMIEADKLAKVNSIKSMVKFFVILTVIGMIAGLIGVMSLLG